LMKKMYAGPKGGAEGRDKEPAETRKGVKDGFSEPPKEQTRRL